jgi:hypothetical protein
MRKGFVFILGGGELAQQMLDGIIVRGLRGAPIEPRCLIFHLLREFAGRLDAQRPVQPNRPSCDKTLHVLATDQRQKIAEFLPMQVEQHVAMVHLFERHFVVHFCGLGIGAAQPVGE